MSTQDSEFVTLEAECCAIHRAIFHSDAPTGLAQRYRSALMQFDCETKSSAELAKLISARCDLEAIEFALRITNSQNVLTRKFRVVLYLCEALPKYDREFVSFEKSWSRGFLMLAYHGIRSVTLAVKGFCLLKYYRVRI